MIPIVGMRVSLFVVALPGWVASRNEATDEHVGRACGTSMWDAHVPVGSTKLQSASQARRFPA